MNLKYTDAGTITRTILLFIALFNQTLLLLGYQPFPEVDEQALYNVISLLFSAVITIWNWWKNNNFTRAGREGQKITNRLKKAKKESSSPVVTLNTNKEIEENRVTGGNI